MSHPYTNANPFLIISTIKFYHRITSKPGCTLLHRTDRRFALYKMPTGKSSNNCYDKKININSRNYSYKNNDNNNVSIINYNNNAHQKNDRNSCDYYENNCNLISVKL